jgi:hypothetical protein
LAILKKKRTPAKYQQWVQSGAVHTDGIEVGDIIDVFTSLGNRPAKSLSIESPSGETIVRFNVCNKIYASYCDTHESWVGLGQGLTRGSPLQLDEQEIATPNLIISADSTMSWTIDDIAINDIKIIEMPSGIKITCT